LQIPKPPKKKTNKSARGAENSVKFIQLYARLAMQNQFQSNGWPSNCTSAIDKDNYIAHAKLLFGFALDKAAIEAAHRARVTRHNKRRLFLNKLWLKIRVRVLNEENDYFKIKA